MEERPVSKRTRWNAWAERLSTRRVLFLVLVAVVVLFLTTRPCDFPIGSLGFFDCPVAKAILPARVATVAASADRTAAYLLPQGTALRVDAQDAIAILDGSLAVRALTYSDGELFGRSIGEIRVGSRRTNGAPGAIHREGESTVLFVTNTRIEIEFRGRLFAMEVRKDDASPMRVYLEPIDRATLKLQRVVDLAVLE